MVNGMGLGSDARLGSQGRSLHLKCEQVTLGRHGGENPRRREELKQTQKAEGRFGSESLCGWSNDSR